MRNVISLTLFVTIFANSNWAHGQPLSLQDALKYAIEHSPTLSNTLKREEIADLELTNRKAAFLPSLDIEGSYGLRKSDPAGITDPWTSGYTLKLTENLYDNGTSIINYKQSRLEREIAELNSKRERDQLALDIIAQFYELSKAKSRADASNEQFKILKTQFDSVASEYRQGLKTRKDFLRLKSQMQSSEIENRNSENALERTALILKRLMGASPADTSITFTPIDASQVSVEAPSVPPALEQTWEIRIAKMTRDLRPYDVELARRRYWPQVFLTAGAQYGADGYVRSDLPYSDHDSYSANVLLNFKFNIWDWGTLNREVQKAKISQTIAENDFNKAQLDTQSEILSTMLDLKVLGANYSLSAELLASQEDALRILQREYREGQTPYLDYINALSERLRSKILYTDARYQLAAAVARYRYYEGKLYVSYFP